MKKKINQYKGKLSATETANGMNIAEQNAFRLVEDATILLDSKRYPTACSLAVLALEELGKIVLLRVMALTTSDSERVEFWKSYRSHTDKNILWLMQVFTIIRSKFSDDSKSIFNEASDNSIKFDQVKQLGFYSDCLGKSLWWNPSKINKDTARKFVKFAKRLAKNNKHTEKEIEIWCKYMGPLWKSKNYNKQAMNDCSDALEKVGISSRVIMGLGEYPDLEE